MRIEEFLKQPYNKCIDFHSYLSQNNLLGKFIYRSDNNCHFYEAILYIMLNSKEILDNSTLKW